MQESKLRFADLSHAKLISIATSLQGPYLDLERADLTGATITDATIDGANWANTTLSHSKLNGSIIIAYMVGAQARRGQPHARLPVLGHLAVCGFLVRDLLPYPDLGHGREQLGLPEDAIRARCRVEQFCEREWRSLVTDS